MGFPLFVFPKRRSEMSSRPLGAKGTVVATAGKPVGLWCYPVPPLPAAPLCAAPNCFAGGMPVFGIREVDLRAQRMAHMIQNLFLLHIVCNNSFPSSSKEAPHLEQPIGLRTLQNASRAKQGFSANAKRLIAN